eukprot:635352-Rhodomonas_salina.1
MEEGSDWGVQVYADYEEDSIYTGEYLSVRNKAQKLDEKFALSSFASGTLRARRKGALRQTVWGSQLRQTAKR